MCLRSDPGIRWDSADGRAQGPAALCAAGVLCLGADRRTRGDPLPDPDLHVAGVGLEHDGAAGDLADADVAVGGLRDDARLRDVDPDTPPVVVCWNAILKMYSPSAGNVWTTEIPPRVPYGAPSTMSHCE